FTTAAGELVEVSSHSGSTGYRYSVGKTVNVLYDKKNPKSAVINTWFNLWGPSLSLLGVSLLSALFSLAMSSAMRTFAAKQESRARLRDITKTDVDSMK